MVAPYHHLTATLVPPMGIGSSFLIPALVLCLVCVIGILIMMVSASYQARCRSIPVLFLMLSLSVVLAVLVARSVLI